MAGHGNGPLLAGWVFVFAIGFGATAAAGRPTERRLGPFRGEAKFEIQQLFTGGTPARRGGGRLPNVVVATNGTVLATHGTTGGKGHWWDKGLQVRRSEDAGKTWAMKRSVCSGPSAYSSLAAGRPATPSEGWIYILLEGGKKHRHEGAYAARFNLSWLLDGEKTGDGEPPK